MRGESSHQCTTHARHKKGERKWLKVSGFDVIVHKRASPSKKLCKYVQYCLESLWKYHAGVDIFFCFVEFAYKGQLANGITFCRMDQLLGDQLCWELCYLIKKILFSEISLKKASFSPNNIILKKKKTEILRILGAMLNMNNTNYEAFGAFKKNNLISRTCTTEGDITN